MRTITLAGSRRGAGRTTLAVELAVCAGHALILDLHPQQSVSRWAQRREADWPVVYPVDTETLDEALEWARRSRFRWVFIDTCAQARPEVTAAAIRAAGFVLIPSRPGSADLGALREVVGLVPRKSDSAIVLNACMPVGGGIRDQLLRQAFLEAGRYGVPVAPCVVSERSVFPKAFEAGQAVMETDPEGKAAADILRLWTWLTQEAHALVA